MTGEHTVKAPYSVLVPVLSERFGQDIQVDDLLPFLLSPRLIDLVGAVDDGSNRIGKGYFPSEPAYTDALTLPIDKLSQEFDSFPPIELKQPSTLLLDPLDRVLSPSIRQRFPRVPQTS